MPAAQDPKTKGKTRSRNVSDSEEPVSSASKPTPPDRSTGNTAETRPTPSPIAPGESYPSAPKDKPRGDDFLESTGRDHPSQSEHAHRAYQKLHGASDQRINSPPGGAPAPKRGFDRTGAARSAHSVKGGGSPRRTQGKGG